METGERRLEGLVKFFQLIEFLSDLLLFLLVLFLFMIFWQDIPKKCVYNKSLFSLLLENIL